MTKKKKILFVNNTLWSLLNFRGHVITSLVADGYEVVIATPPAGSDELEVKLPEGVRFVPVSLDRCGHNPLSDIAYALSLYRIYRRERPDYIFHYTIKPNIYGTLAAKRLGIPCTAVIAGLGYALVGQGFVSRVARTLYRVAVRRADHLLVLNKMNYDYVLRHKFTTPARLILLEGGEGIDLNQYPYGDTTPAPTTFLMVARVLKDKGYDEFVQAAKIVKQVVPDASFQLLGPVDTSNPAHVTPEELHRDIDAGYIEYLGTTNDVQSVVRRPGVVVVLPSYHEGMSRSLMEACAMGRPIITTDIPGCRETVDEGRSGFLVPVKDSRALADAMLRYIRLDDATKQSFCAAARERAERIFDVSIVIKAYKKILQKAGV